MKSSLDEKHNDLCEKKKPLPTDEELEKIRKLLFRKSKGKSGCATGIKEALRNAGLDNCTIIPNNPDTLHKLALNLDIARNHAKSLKDEIKIEKIMVLTGLFMKIGERKKRGKRKVIEMVGGLHISNAPIFPGDPVVVIKPGFIFHDGRGENTLSKAVVEPVTSNSINNNAVKNNINKFFDLIRHIFER